MDNKKKSLGIHGQIVIICQKPTYRPYQKAKPKRQHTDTWAN